MGTSHHDGGRGEDREEQGLSDLVVLLALVGCLLGYVVWRVLACGQLLPGPSAPLRAISLPGWGVPIAVVAAQLVAFGLTFWHHRRRSRRLGRQVTHALIQAGLEGRNPRNPDKPIRPQLRSLRHEGKDVCVMAFRMPVKGSAITLDQIRPHLEQHLDCSVQTWADGGLVWMRLGTRKMPRLVPFDELALPTGGEDLPLVVGVSREGELAVDLTDCLTCWLEGQLAPASRCSCACC